MEATEETQTSAPATRRRVTSATAPAWVVVQLVVVSALLMTLAFPAVWVRNLLLDTDRYVQTVQPLASDPEIQAAVAAKLQDAIETSLDISSLLTDAGLNARLATALGPPIQSSLDSFVDRVISQTLASDTFATFWTKANTLAHTALDRALRGQLPPGGAVRVDENGMLVLDLAPLVDTIKLRLQDRGLSFVAGAIPDTDRSFVLADVSGLISARHWVSLLNILAPVLPILGLIGFAAAIVLARNRRRTAIYAALSIALGLVLVGIILAVARQLYLSSTVGLALTPDASADVFDTLVRFLRLGLRWGVVILLALAGVLAVWGWRPTPTIQGWLNRYRIPVQVGIAGTALLVLLFWDNPTVLVVVVVLVLTAVVLLLAEHARRQSLSAPAAAM